MAVLKFIDIIHFNPLNAELKPICRLLALLGAHHILYVSRIRVNVNGFKLGVYSLQKAMVMLKHFTVKGLLYHMLSGHFVCI